MTVEHVRFVFNLVCLSTDTKPDTFDGQSVGPGSTIFEKDTDSLYKYDGNSWNPESISGAALVNQRDSSGNEITPAFSPGTVYQLTAGVGDAYVAIPANATTIQIKGKETATAWAALAFNNATGTPAVAATDYQFNALDDLPPVPLSIPTGATYIHYIRNGAADVALQLVFG